MSDVEINENSKKTENQPLPIPKIVKKSESRLSIKDMLKKEKELKNKPADENLPEEKYTADRLVRVWRQYAFQVKDEGQETFYNALIKRDPLIEKNDVLKLFVENQIQVDYIKPLLNELISFIRKSVQNYNITIEIELTENPVEDLKLMHGKDKFKAMAKKNPNLNTLKNLFNLDIEF